MNNSPEMGELQRIQESALEEAMAGNPATRDYGREMTFSLVRALAIKALDQALQGRGFDGTTGDRASDTFGFFLLGSAEFIMTATRAALDFTTDPAAALKELREPERKAAEAAHARSIVAARTSVLEASLAADMAEARKRMSADLIRRSDELSKEVVQP